MDIVLELNLSTQCDHYSLEGLDTFFLCFYYSYVKMETNRIKAKMKMEEN